MPNAAVLSGRALDGRYELHDVIGEGAFGRVYRGRDQRLARAVAIKVIKPWWTDDPEWAESFEREAQLMARVNHPGIVQIFDVGYAEEGLYYVAELVDGESLAARLRRGRLTPEEACDVAEQLCRALAQAHAQRVVHLDVKPANVLISRDGRVKVGDFGIARLAEGSTDQAAATIAGTPRYMAPEQARGRPTTPATDVYGTGVVLYEMLAGHPPFQDKAAVELALRHLRDRPPPLPAGTPLALREIVDRALAKDPAARYPSAREMADALARARGSLREAPQEDAALTTRFAPPAEKEAGVAATRVGRRAARRNWNPGERRRYLALLALLVLVTLGVLAWSVFGAARHVTVPSLRGLSRASTDARLLRADLHVSFASRYSQAPPGTVVAQTPAPGARVDAGATERVTLSAGLAPVPVPRVTGRSSGDAQVILQALGLSASVTAVAAPGTSPGIVLQQSPLPSTRAPAHSTVALTVAETPRWRPLTSFSSNGNGQSVPFRIRGTRWRVVYGMSYTGLCSVFSFACSGPTAEVANPTTGSGATEFDLGQGSGQTQGFNSGPGLYQIAVTPGSGGANWSMEVEDYY